MISDELASSLIIWSTFSSRLSRTSLILSCASLLNSDSLMVSLISSIASSKPFCSSPTISSLRSPMSSLISSFVSVFSCESLICSSALSNASLISSSKVFSFFSELSVAFLRSSARSSIASFISESGAVVTALWIASATLSAFSCFSSSVKSSLFSPVSGSVLLIASSILSRASSSFS